MRQLNPALAPLLPLGDRLGVGRDGQEFELLHDLLRVVSDAAVCEARLAELKAATEEARRLIGEVDQRETALETATAEHRRAIAAKREEVDQEIAARLQQERQEQQARERSIRAREEAAQAHELAAAADRKAVAELRADLDKRLAKIRAAAA
jgi:hypothetical protein